MGNHNSNMTEPRSRPKMFTIFLLILCFVVLVYMASFDLDRRTSKVIPQIVPTHLLDYYKVLFNSDSKVNSTHNRRRLILVYTNLFNKREWFHLPSKDAANFASKCRFNNCEITYDRARFPESDAVIFHGRDMPSGGEVQGLLAKRPVAQRWVYFVSESPVNTPGLEPLNGLFNWTMTYKKESDIWLPYQRYKMIEPSDAIHVKVDYAAEKNKVSNRRLAIWIASSCERAKFRTYLVQMLQNHISLDVRGHCSRYFNGPFIACNKKDAACINQIKNYKFYLAFENSFCNQYVTEKYWFNSLQHDVVPIVMGAGPYNDPKVAIPGSFINIADFPTIRALADHLNYLDKNDTAYNEYFRWKQKFKLVEGVGWPFPDIWSCEICEKLHVDSTVKIYKKLSDFWSFTECSGYPNFLKNLLH